MICAGCDQEHLACSQAWLPGLRPSQADTVAELSYAAYRTELSHSLPKLAFLDESRPPQAGGFFSSLLASEAILAENPARVLRLRDGYGS